MEKFTFADLVKVDTSPQHVPGYIAEFGVSKGDSTIAKYVYLADIERSSLTYLYAGEPLFMLYQTSGYVNPYRSYQVTNEVGGTSTGFISTSTSTSTVSIRSVAGAAPSGTSSTAGISTIVLGSYFWMVIRGKIASARVGTTANWNAGCMIKPEDFSTTEVGAAWTAAAATDLDLCGYALTGQSSNKADIFLSMPRWW